ncbi:MAG: hypothetical protein U9N40_04735 [Euryarchaeota archaeon]|nr:hypothetical protein [Euryarchaeota archaeon]
MSDKLLIAGWFISGFCLIVSGILIGLKILGVVISGSQYILAGMAVLLILGIAIIITNSMDATDESAG